MQKSKIQWTDYTWNPVWGCLGGCNYCYARGIAKRFAKPIAEREATLNKRKNIFEDVARFSPTMLDHRLFAEFPKKPSRVFVNSMSDPAFWNRTIRRAVLDRINFNESHSFQMLTKFPQILEFDYYPPNFWLGTSCENQESADMRIPALLEHPAALHFVSFEPLTGHVNLKTEWIEQIRWVIIGGMTGTKATPMRMEWAESLIEECEMFNIQVFFKSWGKYVPIENLTVNERNAIMLEPPKITGEYCYNASEQVSYEHVRGFEYRNFPK